MAIKNATYGRSSGGLTTLKSNIQSQCSSMNKILSGQEYKDLISTLKENWAGTDATDWINDLDKQITDIKKQISTVSTQSQKLLDEDMANFKKFQASNVK